MGGTVRGVPWQAIMDALADREGKIDLTVQMEGSFDEPNFDVHSRILSELDWAMRERAAAAGVQTHGRLFYGLADAGQE